ncbi:MAG: hypothetical protein L6R28_12860 [Planctomycetes bacterium]|nr:hypothetical protein [Planctomycetota bacterium]
MRRRPSGRMAQADSEELTVTPQNVSEMARAFSDGELNSGEIETLNEQLDADPALKRAFEKRCQVLGLVAGSVGSMQISNDFDQKASGRLDRRNKVMREREAQGLKTSARDISTTGLGIDSISPEEEEGEPVAAAGGFMDSLSAQFGSAPWWIISGAFHALLILLVFLIGMVVMQAKQEDLVIVTNLEKQEKPPEPEKKLERDIIEKPIPVVTENEVVTDQQPIVTHEVVEFAEQVETDNDSDAHDTKGEDGISDIWLGGQGTVGSIGVGGGGRAGAFGRPNGAGGRMRRAVAGGGGKATESAVDKALEWLAKHQEPDGHWDTKKYEGSHEVDPGVTALALLAFLGAGHTEKVGKYKDNVQRAVNWIISKQEADGSIGKAYKEFWHPGYAYHHSMCGLALAEAAAMARVPATVQAATKAIQYTQDIHQAGDGQSEKQAWRYHQKDKEGDASVSGWFVMQLKSAKIAGLPVDPASFEGALKWYDSIEVKENNNGPYGGGKFPYQKGKKVALNTTAIGILCNLFLGRKADELQGGAEYLAQNLPTWDPKLGQGGVNQSCFPMYYTYYGTLTMFQMGGHYWKQWNESLKTMLLPKQRVGGDEDGSWDPMGGADDKMGGRVYMTATGALCLEVYYRYMPIVKH